MYELNDNTAGIMGASVRCVVAFAHDDRILYKSVKNNTMCQRLISVCFPGRSFIGTGISPLNDSEVRFEVSELLTIILY